MSKILSKDDPDPVIAEQLDSETEFVVTCDHGGNYIPKHLDNLGLDQEDLRRHIAWDIGALAVAQRLARQLDAALVAQTYSRLLIDCNRPIDHFGSIPTQSEATDIPGNVAIADKDRHARITEIYDPYHATISDLLDKRTKRNQQSIILSIHSFTPVYLGQSRPWEIGVLYGHDQRFAKPVLEKLQRNERLTVGDNQPYQIDEKDMGIPFHALDRGLHNVLFEIRQDLITDHGSQEHWAEVLAFAVSDIKNS